MRDGGKGHEGDAAKSAGGGACVTREGLKREIVAGSVELSKRSGKTSHAVSHSSWNFFLIRLAL